MKIFFIYLCIISLISIAVTAYDKSAAVKGKWRVRESTLILLSVLGGSVAMLITMKIIRHKTKHSKFMIGIPVIIILQIMLVILLYYACL